METLLERNPHPASHVAPLLRGENRYPSNALLPNREDGLASYGWSSPSFLASEFDRAGDGCHCAVVGPKVAAGGDGLGVERDDVAAFVVDCDLWRFEPAGHDVWGFEEVRLRRRLEVA
jgi:hypothetical protein